MGRYNLPSIMLCLALLFTIGCETYTDPVTQEKKMILYGGSQEVTLGQKVAADIEKEFKVSKNKKHTRRVNRIGKSLAKHSDRTDIAYHFTVLETPMVNAMAAPGGFIYVTTGLLKLISSDDELACVIGHEIGHVAARHSMNQLQRNMMTSAVIGVAFATEKGKEVDPLVKMGVGLANQMWQMNYGRHHEFESDQLGMRYAKRAGYDPRGMAQFLEKLGKHGKEQKSTLGLFMRSHPYSIDRVHRCEALMRSGRF